MDNNPRKGSHDSSLPRNNRRSRSSSVSTAQTPGGSHSVYPGQSDAQDVALLAQFAAAAGMSSHGHTNPYGPLMPQGGYSSSISGFNDHLYNDGDGGHTQLPPLSSLDFPWPHFPPQHQGQHSYLEQFSNLQRNMSSPYPFDGTPSIPSNSSESTGGRSLRRSSANPVASTSTSSDPEPNQTEGERAAISEEKRRRNTAASARFRIKKKQRTTNLERSVSDLTGRAEDLEREAADLRRENGWLKEIVMLKGSRLAGANLASHIMAESAQRAAVGQAQSSNISGSREDPSSDEDFSDMEEAPVSKRRGKSRKK